MKRRMALSTAAVLLLGALQFPAHAETVLTPMRYDVQGTVEVYDSTQGLLILDERTYRISKDATVIDVEAGGKPTSDANVVGRPAGLLIGKEGAEPAVTGVWFLPYGHQPPPN